MIPVVLISDGGNSESQAELKCLFSNNLFHIITAELPASGTNTTYIDCEKVMITRALQKAKDVDCNANVIIVKDTSTTQYTSDDMCRLATYDLKGFDILYLGRYGDGCNLYRDETIIGDSIRIVTTYRPDGFQAVIITPSVRDALICPSFNYSDNINRLLAKLVYRNFFKARTVVSNVFTFDILRFARNNTDFDKHNQCAVIAPQPSTGVKASTYFFVAAIVFLIILVGIGMYLCGGKVAPDDAEISVPSSKTTNLDLNIIDHDVRDAYNTI